MNAEKQIVWLQVVAGTLMAFNGIGGAVVTGRSMPTSKANRT